MSEMNCPECEYYSDAYNEMFEHRVREHTGSGDGESFNLYDEEVYRVYVDLALSEVDERLDEDADMLDVKYELRQLGVPVQLSDEELEELFNEGAVL